MSFDGFISYSHAADGRLAPAVQRGLHHLAKPWHRRRALWIFRDQTGLSVTPALWASIQKALDSSDYFVLMASPEASGSPWVNREIEHWVSNKSAERILPVVTDGEWEWDPVAKDFSASSTSVPRALRGVFAEEPLYLDLRWARDDQHLSLRHSRFRDAIAQLAAPMHGISKDDLEGEDVQQHRRASRLRLAAVTSLVLLSGLALLAGVFAARNAAHASASAAEARAQHREASQMRDSAAYFADEALRQENLAAEQQTRAKDAAAEAERQEKVALEQKALAGQASAEATRQLEKADRAAGRARAQEKLAKKQSELAEESAKEMRRSEERAKEQEQIAKQQQQLAAAATAEAEAQEQLAADARLEADVQKGNAEQQQRIAIARTLVNEAKETLPDDPQEAMRLGVAAQQIHPEAETRREVAGMITSTRYAGGLTNAYDAIHAPDNLLLTSNGSGTVSIWNIKDRGNPARLSTFGDGATVHGLSLSRDGNLVALTQGGVVHLWDVSDPADPAELAVVRRELSISGAHLSPDGRTLVTRNSSGENGYASLWDLTDPAQPVEVGALTGVDGENFSSRMVFTPDGRTLVIGNAGMLFVWDIADRENPVVRNVLPARGDLYSYAMSPAEPVLAIAAGSQVYLWDLADPGEPRGITTRSAAKAELTSVAFSANGRIMAAGAYGGTAIIWDLDHSALESTRVTSPRSVMTVALSRDGRTLVTTDELARLAMWDVRGYGTPVSTAREKTQQGKVLASHQSPDGRSMTTVGTDGKAVIWDVTDRTAPVRRATARVHGSVPVASAVVSADGRTVVAVGQDGTVELTDLSDPAKPSRIVSFDPGAGRHSVSAISPNGRILILGGNEQRQVWDLTVPSRPVKVRDLYSISSGRGPVAFSPDSRYLVLADDQLVWLADLVNPADPVHLSFLDGHRQSVTAIAFSPDGKSVVTGGGFDGTTILWDVTDPIRPHRQASMATPLVYPSALAFSRDGKTVAVGGQESQVVLWDVTKASRPLQLTTVRLGELHQVRWLAFSPDGRSVAVGSEVAKGGGAFLELWNISALDGLRADPSRTGCEIAGRGLTAEEWARKIPELKYRATCR